MSKYVKELMMDQLRSDLGGSQSLLILNLKDLDANAEHQFRRSLRKKSIRLRVLKNSLARRVFSELKLEGLSRYLDGPSAVAWGGEGIAELAKEITVQVKAFKKPEIKGGAVDGVVVGPEQVDDITKLPSREVLIGQVLALLLGPARRRWPCCHHRLQPWLDSSRPWPSAGEGQGETAATEAPAAE